MNDTMPANDIHNFHVLVFVENLALKEIASAYPRATRTAHDISFDLPSGGTVFIYPFGAMVFHNVTPSERAAELARLRRARSKLTETSITEDLAVRESGLTARPSIEGGILIVDRLTPARASVLALTVGQSAAMEYYEQIVDSMFAETDSLVGRLEKGGTMPLSTRPLHRFIGAAIGTRSEVLSVLHLLDKPAAAWNDAAIDAIYEALRAELDLGDRYEALELKLRSVQEALELVLDVARDRRLVLLEGSIVLLIVIEIVMSFVRH